MPFYPEAGRKTGLPKLPRSSKGPALLKVPVTAGRFLIEGIRRPPAATSAAWNRVMLDTDALHVDSDA